MSSMMTKLRKLLKNTPSVKELEEIILSLSLKDFPIKILLIHLHNYMKSNIITLQMLICLYMLERKKENQ
jgi:hypothetical protein